MRPCLKEEKEEEEDEDEDEKEEEENPQSHMVTSEENEQRGHSDLL